MEPWVWAIVVPVAVALIGALWVLFGRSTEKGESQNAKDIARVEQRLEDHISEDVKVHERVVRVETTQDIHSREISDLRAKTTGMRHDIMNEVSHRVLSWYTELLERFLKK